MTLTEFAPAKVNLFLHVGAPRPDGRHPVCSLAVFADIGDTVQAEPAPRFSLEVTGPFAGDVGRAEDNLVARALATAGAPPLAVRLDKRLPVASGLGGGSSDAGAALRLAARLHPDLPEAALERAAHSTGADGLLCYRAKAALAEGEGEALSPAPGMPPLPAVLLNPGVPCLTGAVYRAYDETPGAAFSAERPSMPPTFESPAAVGDFLSGQRNDLEAPAMATTPGVREALEALARQPGVLLARMSGSGATVFGLFEDAAAARAAVEAVERPGWWVRACRLNPA